MITISISVLTCNHRLGDFTETTPTTVYSVLHTYSYTRTFSDIALLYTIMVRRPDPRVHAKGPSWLFYGVDANVSMRILSQILVLRF